MASISGNTKVNNVIQSCNVRVYNHNTGELFAETLSNGISGDYSFDNLNPSQRYDVICIYDDVCSGIGGPITPDINTDYSDLVIDSAPTAYWKFDDINSIAIDTMGNYDGVSVNVIYEAPALLNEGVSYDFSDPESIVTIDDHPDLRPGLSEWSVECWIRYNNDSQFGKIFSKREEPSPFIGITVYANFSDSGLEVGRMYTRDQSADGYRLTSKTPDLNDNIARQYVFQRRLVSTSPDVMNLEMYIDGFLDSSIELSSILDLNSTNDIELGLTEFSNSQGFDGLLSDVSYRVGSSLTPTEVYNHYSAALSEGEGVFDNHTILNLQFDSDTSDSSIKNTTITEYNSPVVNSVQPRGGNPTLSLNGTNQYLDADLKGFSIEKDFTLEAWIYRDIEADEYSAILTSYPGTASGFYLVVSGDTGRVFLGFGASGTYIGRTFGPIIPHKEWIHVAVCRSGSDLHHFINGNLELTTSVPVGIVDYNNEFYIGRGLSSRYFHGYMDDVIVTATAKYTDDFTPT